MRPLTINGQPWRVIRVTAGDPRLVDGTGIWRIATTDPRTHEICVSEGLQWPLLDRVMIHEALHAIVASYGLLGPLSGSEWQEWGAQLVERHGLEAVKLASDALGRAVCVMGLCYD